MLVAVDDAHWLDAESLAAIVFAARRLQAERVAVVVAARTGEGRDLRGSGLPVIALAGLSAAATGELLTAGGKPADAVEAERIRALTGGNPLALIELPAARARRRRSDLHRSGSASSAPSRREPADCPGLRKRRCWCWPQARATTLAPSPPGSRC